MLVDFTNMLRPIASSRGVSLIVSVDPCAPREIITDAKRLLQCLVNLASNATRFAKGGHVELRYLAVPEAPQREVECNLSPPRSPGGEEQCAAMQDSAAGTPVRLLFQVVDSGTGIARTDLMGLF